MRSLGDIKHDVTVVAAESMAANRLTLGWKVPDLGRARVVVNPSPVETSA